MDAGEPLQGSVGPVEQHGVRSQGVAGLAGAVAGGRLGLAGGAAGGQWLITRSVMATHVIAK